MASEQTDISRYIDHTLLKPEATPDQFDRLCEEAPLGAMTSTAKGFETRCAVEDGAREIDMVINIGRLKAQDYRYVEEDIRAVRAECPEGTILKVIIETALLSDSEKVRACEIAVAAGADFVKTSTGFSLHGATVADVALMRKTVGPSVGVKAAGGVRSLEDAAAMIEAGVKIVQGEKIDGGY